VEPEKIFEEVEELITGFTKKVLQHSEARLMYQVSQLFKTEGKSLNVNWEPVNEKYFKQKVKKGFSEKILHRTTTLAQSFHGDVKENSLIFGTPVKYALFHETGTSKMPKRPIFEPLFQDLTENLDGIVQEVEKQLFGR